MTLCNRRGGWRLWAGAAVVLLLVPLSAQAAVFLSGEKLRETTETTQGDLFIWAESVAVFHAVRDDVFAAGDQVSIEAPIGGDIVAAGNQVRVTGEIDDDILAAGNTVRIDANRADDVMAAGSVVTIAGKNIVGSVFAAGEDVALSGTIAGDVRVAGASVVVKSGTSIGGDLITYGSAEPVLEDGVTVAGATEHREKDSAEHTKSLVAAAVRWAGHVVTWFAVGTVLLYLLRGAISETITGALTKSGRSLIIGLLAAAVVVPGFIGLAVTVVGLPLAFLLLLLTGAHLIVAYSVAAIVAGVWVLQRVTSTADAGGIHWQHVLLGAVVVQAMKLVPFIGGLAVFVLVLMTWGALLDMLWKRLRAPHYSTTPPAA